MCPHLILLGPFSFSLHLILSPFNLADSLVCLPNEPADSLEIAPHLVVGGTCLGELVRQLDDLLVLSEQHRLVVAHQPRQLLVVARLQRLLLRLHHRLQVVQLLLWVRNIGGGVSGERGGKRGIVGWRVVVVVVCVHI